MPPKKQNTSTSKRPKKKSSQLGKPMQVIPGMVGAAQISRPIKVGMSDIPRHTISWLVGFTYVGNNTLGATDSVYFEDPSKTYTIEPQVPIAPADNTVGAVYALDVLKHFARIRVVDARLNVTSLQPSTSNSMVAIIAPLRGLANVFGSNVHSDTTAGNSYTNVISMTDVLQLASWQSGFIPLRQYIAGGSGAAQNEFSMAATFASSTDLAQNATGLIPLALAVSGVNTTTALRGTSVHAIFCEIVVDLLDFIGGMNATNNVGVFLDIFAQSRKRDSRKNLVTPEPGVSVISREDQLADLRRQISAFVVK